MDNSIYQVDRDEYVGFIDSIKPTARRTEVVKENGYTHIKLYSSTKGTLFATRIIPPEEAEELETYYIFNLPDPEETQEPRPRIKIRLDTREEVQAFVNLLGKLQKGEKL